MFNIPLAQFLIASIIAGIIGFGGLVITSTGGDSVHMDIEPESALIKTGDKVIVSVMVESNVPVNAFSGLIRFDANLLKVDSIDYNTSIANLWTEKPWYSNGDGTINFTGGTTRGGFIGKGNLIDVTFVATAKGEASIAIEGARIFKHDGLGTEVSLDPPINASLSVEDLIAREPVVLKMDVSGPTLSVVDELPDTDLNDDGRQTMADVSIFMVDFSQQNLRSDFNHDGQVTLKDLSILTIN
jgi:hypothetical protein